MPLPIIGAALGIAGTIGKMFARGKANSRLRQLQREDPIYKANPLAAQRLGLANTLLNARSPGAVAAERNIFSTQANSFSNAQRGATDASQLLATGGAIQGQTNDAFNQLDQQENQDYQRRLQNQVGAQEGVIQEGDKVYNDEVRRFGDKTQFQGAISANQAANWGDIANAGFSLADFGMNGGFGGFAKKKPTSGYSGWGGSGDTQA